MNSDDGSQRVRLLRGTLRDYDATEHTAAVEPVGASTALLEDLPVLGCVAPAELLAGRAVSLLLWPDVGGVVLGPAVAPLASLRLWEAGCASLAADQALGTAYANLMAVERALPADGVLYAQGVMPVEVTDHQWPNLSLARIAVDGTGQGEAKSRALENQACETLAPCWAGPLEAGERTWALQARKNGPANTHTALAGAHLAWMIFV